MGEQAREEDVVVQGHSPTEQASEPEREKRRISGRRVNVNEGGML